MVASALLGPPVIALTVDSHLRTGMPSHVTLKFKMATQLHARETLFVYLPGILAGAESSSTGLRDLWLQHGDVLLVEYEGERFRADQVVRKVSAYVKIHAAPYKRIVFIGSSMGGLLAFDIVQQLSTETQDKVDVVNIDAPTSACDFQSPLDKSSKLMHILPFGPISNLVSGPIMNLLAVPPQEKNIEPGVDRGELERRFKEMTGYPLSFYRDQVMYIITHGRPAEGSLRGIHRLVYMRSRRDTDTVRETAYDFTWMWTTLKREYYEFDTTHVGYAERPKHWRAAFEEVFDALGV